MVHVSVVDTERTRFRTKVLCDVYCVVFGSVAWKLNLCCARKENCRQGKFSENAKCRDFSKFVHVTIGFFITFSSHRFSQLCPIVKVLPEQHF